ncbi:MAG: hypothetical protein RR058_01815 [Oscillospiraceae bacterium]
MSKLFGKNIVPSCEYCIHGKDSLDYKMILCKKHGVVSPYFRCGFFKYSPIRRKPKRPQGMTKHDPQDFAL